MPRYKKINKYNFALKAANLNRFNKKLIGVSR